jgi:hypothetical protein
MRKLVITGLLVLGIASVAAAQAISTSKFGWGQDAPDLASAQGYTYKHYDDGSATGVVFSNVTCSGTASPFQCEALVPAYTPGTHSLQLTASNLAGESAKSTPFSFTFVVTPSAPTNLRIIQSGGL